MFSSGVEEGFEGSARMRLAHEGFADEEGVEAGVAQAVEVGGRVNAAFGDVHGVGRQISGESERGFKANVEGAEVAIVHAVAVAAEIADAGQFVGGVDFTEDVKLERVGGGGEAGKFGVGECGGDEQDGIGVMGAGFDDLVFVHDEIFAEAGDICRDGSQIEVGESSLEEGLVGEDGERGSAGGLEIAGEEGSVEVSANQAFGGGSFLELGDDRGSGLRGGTKSAGESAGRMRGCRFFQQAQRGAAAAFGEIGAGLVEDAIEMEQTRPLFEYSGGERRLRPTLLRALAARNEGSHPDLPLTFVMGDC